LEAKGSVNRSIASLGLCVLGAIAGTALAGTGAAAAVPPILPALGGLISGVAGNAAADLLKDGRRDLAARMARTDADGFPLNHDLARLVRISQCEGLEAVVAAFAKASPYHAGFRRKVLEWSKAARSQAERDDFLEAGVGRQGRQELAIVVEAQVAGNPSPTALGAAAEAAMRDELTAYLAGRRTSMPDEFEAFLIGRSGPGWRKASEAFFAYHLKQPDGENARTALMLVFGQTTLGHLVKVDDVLNEVLAQGGEIGDRLFRLESQMKELLSRTAMTPAAVTEALRDAVINGEMFEALAARLERLAPKGCGWTQSAHQVNGRIERLQRVPLFGSADHLDRLNRFVEENPSGLMMVEGERGTRKSAMLAQWVGERRDDYVVRHFVYRSGDATIRATEVLGHLAVQLLAMSDEAVAATSVGHVEELRDLVYERIAGWDAVRGRLIVVVDGLDQVSPSLDVFVEAPLPVGVFVVVSCATDNEAHAACLENWRRRATADGRVCLSDLDDDAVVAMVEASLDLTGAEAASLANTLTLSTRNPTRLHALIEEMRVQPRDAASDWRDSKVSAQRRLAARNDALPFLAAAMQTVIGRDEAFSAFGHKSFGGETVLLPLERIYTALRADPLSAEERSAAHELFADASNLSLAASRLDADRHRRLDMLGSGLDKPASSGIVASIAGGEATKDSVTQNLASALKDRSQMVVLGEPASGKSTLLRWLSLRYAKAWLASDGDPTVSVSAPAFHIDPRASGDEPLEIGKLKLPIFVTMAAVAAFVADRDDFDLMPLLARLLSSLAGPEHRDVDAGQIVEMLASEGRLLILLDGLDEVIDIDKRGKAIHAVAAFAEAWARPGLGGNDTGHRRANRLVVTSRVVGYHEMRLPSSWPHVVVDRMDAPTVHSFWTRLFDVFREQGLSCSPDAVDQLHQRVYGEEGGALEDLVGIPLLATLLAIAYQAGNEHLPQRRIEIYDRCVSHLVADWKSQTDDPIDVHEWRRMLGPVAAWMHDHAALGLIQDSRYLDILTAGVRAGEPNLSEAAARKMARIFLEQDSRWVGLLAERGDRRFGFLHRTFQEYLSASWLMSDAELAIPRILERWKSPSWREPILLAFGHESLRDERDEKSRRNFFTGLLEGVLAEQRPRFAIMLASAVFEMPTPPGEGTIRELIRQILRNLRGQSLAEADDRLREQIEDAIYFLADRDSGLFEAALASILQDTSPDSDETLVDIRIAAELVARERWFTPVLVRALKTAKAVDSAAHGFPIYKAHHQGISQALLPVDPEPRPVMRGPNGSDPTRDERVFSAEDHAHRLRRWRVRGQFLERRLRPQSPNRDAEMLLGADVSWRAVGIVLFGALGNHDAVRDAETDFKIVSMLQEPDIIRERILRDEAWYRRSYGGPDTVYNAAVHLDERRNEFWLAAELAPVADARTAAPIGPIPRDLMEMARNGAGYAAMMAAAAKAPPGESRATFHLAAALSTLGGIAEGPSFQAELSPGDQANLYDLVASAKAAIGDACFRAFHALTRSSELSGAGISPLALDLAWEVAARFWPDATITPPDALTKLSPRLLAEQMRQRLEGEISDDHRYNSALAMDAVIASPEPGSLAQRMAESSLLGFGARALWPLSKLDAGLSPQALDWLIIHDPGLYPDELARPWDGLATGVGLADKPSASAVVALQLGADPMKVAPVADADHPYFIARALLLQVEIGVALISSVLDPLLAHARRCDPIERYLILERTITLVNPEQAPAVVAEARLAAHAIDDSSDRWRAIGRLTLHLPDQITELHAQIRTTLAKISDDDRREADLRAAIRTLGPAVAPPNHPDLADPVDTGFGSSLWWSAPRLLALAEHNLMSYDAALALAVGQALLDLEDWIKSDRSRAEFSAGRLTLTAGIAPTLNLALQAGEAGAEEMLARLEILSTSSLLEARNWLGDPGSPLAFECAAALFIGTRKKDIEVLRPLVHGLLSGDNARSTRAAAVLTRGTFSVTRPPVTTFVKEVGLEGLLAIGSAAVGHGHKAGTAATCFIADIIFDDEPTMMALCDLAESGDEGAAFVIQCIGFPSDEVVEALAARLVRSTSELQKAIIRGLAAAAGTSLCEEVVLIQLKLAAPYVSAEMPIFLEGGTDVAVAIDQALQLGDHPDPLAAAMANLEAQSVSLATALADDELAPRALTTLFERTTIMGEELSPMLNGRDAFRDLRRRHGARAIDLVCHWLCLALDDDGDEYLLGYLTFGASEYAISNPILVRQALLRRVGSSTELNRALSRLSSGSSSTISAAGARLACRLGEVDAGVINALFVSVASPIARSLHDLERVLQSTRLDLSPDALELLEQSVTTESLHRAFVTIRLLGSVARNPIADASHRLRARNALDRMFTRPIASQRLVTFVDGKDGRTTHDHGPLSGMILRELSAAT